MHRRPDILRNFFSGGTVCENANVRKRSFQNFPIRETPWITKWQKLKNDSKMASEWAPPLVWMFLRLWPRLTLTISRSVLRMRTANSLTYISDVVRTCTPRPCRSLSSVNTVVIHYLWLYSLTAADFPLQSRALIQKRCVLPLCFTRRQRRHLAWAWIWTLLDLADTKKIVLTNTKNEIVGGRRPTTIPHFNTFQKPLNVKDGQDKVMC